MTGPPSQTGEPLPPSATAGACAYGSQRMKL